MVGSGSRLSNTCICYLSVCYWASGPCGWRCPSACTWWRWSAGTWRIACECPWGHRPFWSHYAGRFPWTRTPSKSLNCCQPCMMRKGIAIYIYFKGFAGPPTWRHPSAWWCWDGGERHAEISPRGRCAGHRFRHEKHRISSSGPRCPCFAYQWPSKRCRRHLSPSAKWIV